MKPIYLNRLSIALALLVSSQLFAAGKEKNSAKNNSGGPSFTLKGKTFKFKPIAPITVRSEANVEKPKPYSLPEGHALSLPTLSASPSLNAPRPPTISVVKLPPLVRYALKASWAGGGETRLSPEWKSPGVAISDPSILTMDSFSDGEFKLLEALLLLKSKETTPMSIGLAQPLTKTSETRSAAHEILARSLLNLQIRTGAFEHFNELFRYEKEGPRAKRSIELALGALLPTDYDEAQRLSSPVQKLNVADDHLANFPLIQARLALNQKELQKAWETLNHIPNESPQGRESRFLRAMIYYRSNNATNAVKELEDLLQTPDKLSKDLKSLAATTLAKIYFQQGLYQQASSTYKLIEQDHPLWLESLVENAWSQILSKDYEGAAGNMFSLHTTYFKGAYQPESYIVRTVSYLQLCQFGDALSTLTDFLRKYKFAKKQLVSYKQQNPNHLEVVREFLKAGSPKKFAGLPRSLLVEIARDPKFIELQKHINEIEEDSAKMAQLGSRIEELDQQLLQKQNKYTKLLQDLDQHIKKSGDPTKKDALIAEQESHQKHIQRLSLLRKIILDAKQGLIAENQTLVPIWGQKKVSLKGQQNSALQGSFANLEKDLNHWIDQSELLFYEIHNGAGEHLRYQMATTTAGEKRAPANDNKAFKKEDQDLQWSFDGEIWEDEVGHYRSSLKNVCPEDEIQRVSSKKPANPAPLANSDEP